MLKFNKHIITLLLVLIMQALVSGCVAKPSDDSNLTEDKTTATTTEAATEATTEAATEATIEATTEATTEAATEAATEATTEATTEAVVQKDTDLSKLQNTILDNKESVGIAYIGYVGYEADEEGILKFVKDSQYADKYEFLCGAPLVNVGGAELYAIVIADTKYSASVYRAKITDNGEYSVNTDNALYNYDGNGVDYFLLRCNESEIYSNVSLSFKKGNDSFSVSPMLSGMDGQLVDGKYYDFSMYTDYGGNGESEDKDVAIAREILLESQEVQYYISMGMSVQYTGQIDEIEGRSCWIFALGTDRDDQFVRERYYGVCDNLIYFYDSLNDKWEVLGKG